MQPNHPRSLICMSSFLASESLRSLAVSLFPSPTLPSFSSNFQSCSLRLSPTRQPRLLLLSLPPLLWHAAPSLCCHPEEVAVTMAGPVQHSVVDEALSRVIIPIIVIISQMRRAKLELCPSPSGWLTVTNSSLIHSTHELYTGQRSPERQEAARAPLSTCRPQLQHKDTSVLGPYHQCPSSVSLRAADSLSSCLEPPLLCADVMQLIGRRGLDHLAQP